MSHLIVLTAMGCDVFLVVVYFNFCIYDGTLLLIYFKTVHHPESLTEIGGHTNWKNK